MSHPTNRDRDPRRDPDPDGFGDDQGTRVGEPTPSADETTSDAPHPRTRTGAGSESSRGIEGANDGGSGPGSEPLEHRDEEHQSQYGGGARSDFQGSE